MPSDRCYFGATIQIILNRNNLGYIAKELGTRPTRVSKWRNRFAQLTVPGLEDEPRSGRRIINDESVERRILDQLAKAPPPGFAALEWPVGGRGLPPDP
jgi:hypothetical protein